MPSSVGPYQTRGSNLVFNYDVGDVANSYIGEPTTNLASGLGLIGMSGISLNYIGLEDGWIKYSMGGTFTGGGYPYIMYLNPVTFTGGQFYSTQAIVKTNVPYKFNYFGTSGISYVNEPKISEGSLTQTTLPDGSSYITRFGFAYTNTTSQPGYLYTNPINNTTFNSSTDFVYLKNFQVEQKNHCTQYTPTSRSTTQGLLDISGYSNIVTLNTSYDANAMMYFDGTDDYINASTTLGADCTLELVIQSSNYNVKIPISLDGNNYSSGPNIFFYNNVISWNTGDSADNPFSNSSYPNSNYHHIVVSNTSGVNAILYIDGVQIGTARSLNATTTGANKLWIGRFHGDNNYTIAGNIPVVKVYNRVLSTSEITTNYNSYKKRFNLS